MKLKKYQSLLIVAGGLLVIYAWVSFSNFGSVFVHSITNIFAGGRSSVKILLFFAYTLTLCLTALPFAIKTLSKVKIRTSYLFGTLALAFSYNLFLFWLFCYKFGFKLSDFIITFNNNEVSSTMLFHNHLMKGLNGLVLNLFGSAVQENVDTGWAFVGLISEVWFWLGGILVLASIAVLIIKFAELYKLQTKWHGLYLILYSVISFSLIKNLLDGGLLNRETPVALAALLFLVFTNKPQPQKSFGKLQVLPSLSMVLSYIGLLFIFAVEFPALMSQFWFSLFMVGVLSICLFTIIYLWNQQKINRLGVLLAIFSLMFIYIPLSQDINNYFAGQQILNEDGAYVGLYQAPQADTSISWLKLEGIGNLGIYKASTTSQVSVQKIMKENNLLSNLGPISVPWVNCIPTFPDKMITFELATYSPLGEDSAKHNFGSIQKIKKNGQISSLYRYEVTVRVNRCAPRVLNIIQELVAARGQNTFFILNLFENDSNAL